MGKEKSAFLEKGEIRMQYEIKGDNFPVVICQLSNGEQMFTEAGSMVWMTPNMEMSTSGGGLGSMFSRALSGENLFQNIYKARGDGMIAFGSSFPGRILAIPMENGREIILQKRAFLAAESGVQLAMHFQRKLGAGFFGGEGFIMQRTVCSLLKWMASTLNMNCRAVSR